MAELAAMRYKDYVWPHNPRVYTIEYHRDMAVQKFPMGVYHLQDLGRSYRVLKGEGEFVGPEAYDQFKELATLFYAGGTGPLIHPVWQPASAYFVELSLRQEPRPDYVSYTFTFWEGPSETPGLKEYGTERTGESVDGGTGSAGTEAESAAGSAVCAAASGRASPWPKAMRPVFCATMLWTGSATVTSTPKARPVWPIWLWRPSWTAA